MKAIFLSSNSEAVRNVYSQQLKNNMFNGLEFIQPLFDLSTLHDRKEELNQVELIFSTWGMPYFTKNDIQIYFPNVKAVFYAAGSVQAFAREFIESGITVFSAWAANAVPVAEFTVAQVILANKGYFQRLKYGSTNTWQHKTNGGDFDGTYNTNVGIIGAGMIGTLVIQMLKKHSVNILVFDPFLSNERAHELGVTKTSLETLFSECNVISNHIANNPQTVGMINKNHFNLMKSNSTFINTGRGAQIVEADLIDALKNQPNRVALLDVTNPEPPTANSDLYKLENVFLSPHIAGSIGSELQRMGQYMYEEYKLFVENKPTNYHITLKMLDTMA